MRNMESNKEWWAVYNLETTNTNNAVWVCFVLLERFGDEIGSFWQHAPSFCTKFPYKATEATVRAPRFELGRIARFRFGPCLHPKVRHPDVFVHSTVRTFLPVRAWQFLNVWEAKASERS